ncbi:MAG: aminotransferase class V-fold PLP-dependent enzyme [Planctomycetes bacterium]|nr:aminotransferase class V-fold PLP-dependent enzyme [Planctomycetota bacterium]
MTDSVRLRALWGLDPEITFLNHGSFGATPIAVLQEQDRLRRELEREPVRFLHRELEERFDAARAEIAAFVGADPDDLAFVNNATAGVNTVLRSLRFEPGDEIVVNDQEYNATRNAVDFVAARAGARVVEVHLPFPIAGPEPIVAAVLDAVGPRTKLVVIDHITSQTGMILPVDALVPALAARGVDALVDGAHAPGQIDLDLGALGAAYYTANCHKWLCTPKGSAILHVRRDRQAAIRPLAIGHGANSPRTDRSRFRLEFDQPGTIDPTPWLTVPFALRYLAEVVDGGWPAIRRHNHDLVVAGRRVCLAALGAEPPCPESMIGSLASMPLPDAAPRSGPQPCLDPVHVALFDEHRIEVPVMTWPRPPHKLLRISAQVYNTLDDYRRLADVLPQVLRA